MKRTFCLIMALTLMGCTTTNFHRVHDPEVNVSVEPGQVHAHADLHLQSVVRALNTPRLESQNEWGGWTQVWGQYLTMPGSYGGMNIRLAPGGRVSSAQYSYDGSEWRSISPPCWCFAIPNYKDGGNRPLKVRIFFQDPNTKPEPVESHIWVENGLGS